MKNKYGQPRKKDDEHKKLSEKEINRLTNRIGRNGKKIIPSSDHKCSRCKKIKIYSEFGIHANHGWLDDNGYRRKSHCRECDNLYNKNIHEKNPINRLYNLAKRRAKNRNLEFNLTKDYIKSIFPKDNKCPVTGKEFQYGLKNRNYAPTIDKINPKNGYIIGNVVIISHIMNAFKSDIDDIEMIKKLYEFYKKL